VKGAGQGIGGTADQFHFSHQPLSGDMQLMARVTAVGNTAAGAKAGLMFRESLEKQSRMAFLSLSPAGGAYLTDRTEPTNPASEVNVPGLTPPYWLKLERKAYGYTAYTSANGSTWTQRGSQGFPTANMYAGLAVTAGHTTSLNTSTFDNVTVLTDVWTDADVGGPSQAGGTTGSSTLTVQGGGTNIAGTADQFHYRYRTLQGDGTFTVRVASVENTNAGAKAGIMIRETLEPGSRNALVFQTPTSGYRFQWRSGTSGTTTLGTAVTGNAPRWLRLTRAGDKITGLASTDGSTWTQVGTAAFPMGRTAYIGLAVTSLNTTNICDAVFDNVQ
jgi:regulation of enolase protein 1 (concanavalin A-like superfamily)